MQFSFIEKNVGDTFIPRNNNNLYNNINDVNGKVETKNYYWQPYAQEKNNWGTEGSIQKSLMSGINTPTPVGEIFFSQENINRLQKKIKYELFVRTNGKYKLETNQNESDLLVVMRAVFITCATHMPYKIVSQVKELNHRVIERIIPDMISIVKQDDEYIKQLDRPINPIPLPVCMNSKGRLALPSVTTTFFPK